MTTEQDNATTRAMATEVSNTSSTYEQDQKTQAQLEAIEKEIKANQALTSNLKPMSNLTEIYEQNDTDNATVNFIRGCEYLSTKYSSWRMIRGDGNCYYRAFLYAVCEELLRGYADGGSAHKAELDRLIKYVQSSIDEVTKYGYDRFTIETFHEELVELFDFIAEHAAKPFSESELKLHSKLNEENSASDYCTWYMRVITSSYLKRDPDRFIHFLDDPNYFDVATFCSREVDPMGRECGFVSVLALAEAMGVRVNIEYLDGRNHNSNNTEASTQTNALTMHQFGPEQDANKFCLEINLLYRPGHYDILYTC